MTPKGAFLRENFADFCIACTKNRLRYGIQPRGFGRPYCAGSTNFGVKFYFLAGPQGLGESNKGHVGKMRWGLYPRKRPLPRSDPPFNQPPPAGLRRSAGPPLSCGLSCRLWGLSFRPSPRLTSSGAFLGPSGGLSGSLPCSAGGVPVVSRPV